MKDPLYYRNKLQYPIGFIDKTKVMGVYSERSHNIVPTTKCMIQNELCQDIANYVFDYIKENKIKVYDEKTNTGTVRHIIARIGIKTNEILLTLVVNDNGFKENKEDFIQYMIIKYPQIRAIVLNYNQENTSYVSRLDLVKLSVENNINSLLKNSPETKVGIVSFGSEIEVKGDCLSNIMKIKEKDMNNESKIQSLGEENTNLIKSPIKQSYSKILESLHETEENGSTALGPAVLLSLSLLKNAKIGSRIFLCTDGMSNLGIGDISKNRDEAKTYYTKIGDMAKEKGIVINLITFEDSESEIEILMNMVKNSGGEIIRVNPNLILDGFNDLLENEVIASEVEIKMNLNKCMTFRDKEEKDMINDGATISVKLGNVTKETETYFELKFKKAIKLAEMKDINFDELKNLIFQCEIIYKKKNGGKYIRIISKNLKISDNKEEVEGQANFDIISTMEIQKSAKLASEGLYREAQAQAHVTRKYLLQNRKTSKNSSENYDRFNCNMNFFNSNLEKLHNEKIKSYPLQKKKNYKNDKINSNSNTDVITEQIFSLSRTSQNRQKVMFKRSKK